MTPLISRQILFPQHVRLALVCTCMYANISMSCIVTVPHPVCEMRIGTFPMSSRHHLDSLAALRMKNPAWVSSHCSWKHLRVPLRFSPHLQGLTALP